MIYYPAESCLLVQNLKEGDFTSDFTKRLGKGCLFELNGYDCVRTEAMFESLVSERWNMQTINTSRSDLDCLSFDIVYFNNGLEVVKEVIRGAVGELKHERFCTNRRFK
jgi:hypothetical protein